MSDMSTTPIATPAQLKDAYKRVKERIAEAAIKSGRRPEDVLLVAVTKTASLDQIRTVLEMGHIDLGESRVQQLAQRAAQLDEFLARKRTWQMNDAPESTGLPAEVRWHMIGHMQRNKVKQIVPMVRLIHSVDSLRLAEELHAFGGRLDKPIDVLMQVNVSGEETKSGITAPAAPHLAEQLDSMINLRLRGIMTMAPRVEDSEQIRSVFARTRELFEDIRETGLGGPNFNILSMGMTDDYEIAVEEGANIVRVGRGIFGDRDDEA